MSDHKRRPRHLTSEQVAYRHASDINADCSEFGTFAEIGAAQEVSRYFFRAGGAQHTVAKTISAYAKEVSDAIYLEKVKNTWNIPHTERFRLIAMLRHEYELLMERFQTSEFAEVRKRAELPFPLFFVYANTVAIGPYGGKNEQFHGWMGVRIQLPDTPNGEVTLDSPRESYVDLLAHVVFLEETTQAQRDTVGALGVNLLATAIKLVRGELGRKTKPLLRRALIQSILEGIETWKIRLGVLEVAYSRPRRGLDGLEHLGLALLENRCTNAIVISNHRDDVPREIGRLVKESTASSIQRMANFQGLLQHHLKIDPPAMDRWAYSVGALRVPVRFLYSRHIYLVPVVVTDRGFEVANRAIEKAVAEVIDRKQDDHFVLFVVAFADLPKGHDLEIDGRRFGTFLNRFLLGKQRQRLKSIRNGTRPSSKKYPAAMLVVRSSPGRPTTTPHRAMISPWIHVGWLCEYVDQYIARKLLQDGKASLQLIVSGEQWSNFLENERYQWDHADTQRDGSGRLRESIAASATAHDCLIRLINSKCTVRVIGPSLNPEPPSESNDLVRHLARSGQLRYEQAPE
ncbi:MAG TPA: hypothetical protein VFE47_09245 [Tepidisphaeraceae bacterium]|jgi:hypothetical protein|nr:hypothetical protein [Tepidisphaeraceae bacterium]